MTSTPMRTPVTAAVGEIAARPVVLHYGDVGAEYAAMHDGAVVVDRSARLRLSFSGTRAAETLAGLVTNDVLALTPGHGQYAAALTPKGKIIADVRIFARAEELVVDAPPRAAAGLLAMVRKFVNPRLAAWSDRSEAVQALAVAGPQSRRVVAETMGVQAPVLEALPPYGHVGGAAGGSPIVVARVPDVGLEAYELFVPAVAVDAVLSLLAAAGAVPAGLEAWEIARVEAGRPEWGIDIDDTTLPQEANFDDLHAISYTKGCYTGQETVARVHFRGHVNRHLRGMILSSGAAVPARAAVIDETGKTVGDVRSIVRSPRLGWIALGMVRREVAAPARVRVSWDGGETMAQVTALPFGS
jgi:folate-binding protein YgfZ